MSNNPSVGQFEEKEYKVLIVDNSFDVSFYDFEEVKN